MQFKQACGLAIDLLKARTYTDLQALENELVRRGVKIDDDFIMTDDRKAALDGIARQIAEAAGATVVITGWYGSGKTTVLGELLRRFEDKTLKYGGRIEVDPIEIRLNEDNTATEFLESLLGGIANLVDVSLVTGTYASNRAFRDLPDKQPKTVRALVELLVSLDVSDMDKVKAYLRDLFQAYKSAFDGKRIIGLVIDELENITQPEREAEPKLAKLLQGLFDSAVREFVDQDEVRKDPFVLVIIDIISRSELERGGWLRQDTLDRADSWTYDINLTRQSANLLMRSLLRLYFEAVIGASGAGASDPRVESWSDALQDHPDPESDLYTFPITRRVHRAFSHALLDVIPATGAIISFRAYQEGVSRLLEAWDGVETIDLGYMIDHSQELRQYFGERDTGVNLNRLVDEASVLAYVQSNSSGVAAPYRRPLGLLTRAAISKSTSHEVAVGWDDLDFLPEEDRPSVKVVEEVLRQIAAHSFAAWTVAGDTLVVDVELVLSDIAEQGLEAERDWIAEALEATATRRESSVANLAQSNVGHSSRFSAVVTNGILEIKPSVGQPLLIGYRFAFDGSVADRIPEDQLWIGVELGEDSDPESGLPVSVRVRLPKALAALETAASDRLTDGLERRWGTYSAISKKLVEEEGLSPRQAFVEAMKLSFLIDQDEVPPEIRGHVETWGRDFVSWFLVDLGLTDALRRAWISSRLGFSSFHEPDEIRRMIRVMAGSGDGTLAYASRDGVPDRIDLFEAVLPAPQAWDAEVDKWEASEQFIKARTVVAYGDLPTALRSMLTDIDGLMAGQALSFSTVAQHLMGGASISGNDGAQLMLHLLLRIGALTMDWLVKDSVKTYKDVMVMPKEATLRQAKQKAANRVSDAVASAVFNEVLNVGTGHKRRIGELLSLRDAIGEAKSTQEIDSILAQMPSVSAPQTGVPLETPQELGPLGTAWDGVRKYLDMLERLADSPTDGVTIICSHAEPYRAAIALEADYLLRLKKRDRYADLLGRKPKAAKKATLLQALATQEFDDGEKMRSSARELATKFEQRARLVGVDTADGRTEVITWARALAAIAMPSGLASDVSASDLDRITQETDEYEAAVGGLAADLRAQASSALESIERSRSTLRGAAATKALALKTHLLELFQVTEAVTERVTVAAATQLLSLRETLSEWEAFQASEVERNSQLIRSELKTMKLLDKEEMVLKALTVIQQPLRIVLERLEIDPATLVKSLKEGKADGLDTAIVLVAAAAIREKLDNADKSGE